MRFRASNLPLVLGLIASLIVHAWLIVPLLIAMMRAESRTLGMQARFNPEDFDQPDAPEEENRPETVELGIDAETPSTLTWIGYEEYEEHLARLSEVEQAAFTDEPAGGALAMETSAVPEPAEAPQNEPNREEANEANEAAASARSLAAMLDWLSTFSPERFAVPFAPEQPIEPASERAEQPSETDDDAAADADASKDADARETQPREEPKDQSADEPTRQPGEPGASEIGEHADKESDPTSIVDVPFDKLQPGKPIARPGLEVKPHRPEFPILTRLTALAGNPLVEIRFGRAGRPLDVELLTSSGNAEIDKILRSSLYKWRAAGKALAELEGEQTIDVRVRIIFNPRGG
jgi:outer membrane biosynthesis protein TonB